MGLAMLMAILCCAIWSYAARYALLIIMAVGAWSGMAMVISLAAGVFQDLTTYHSTSSRPREFSLPSSGTESKIASKIH